MIFYTGQGERIEVTEVTTDLIKSTFGELVASGAININTVGSTLPIAQTVSDAWKTNAETAYTSMKTAYESIGKAGIPFFISTDQHGGGLEYSRWVNNRDVDSLDVININLGDTVTGHFNLAELESAYNQTKLIKNYIGVAGNHDYLYSQDSDIPTQLEIDRVFFARNARCYNQYGYKMVIDDAHNCKWLALDSNSIDLQNGNAHGFEGEQIDWLIDELMKGDGYDIIILHHEPFPATYTLTRTSEIVSPADSDRLSVGNMLSAYKQRTNGTCIDMDGNNHTYDFTSAEGRILCMFHGHWHWEGYSTEGNILRYVAMRQTNGTKYGDTVFGLVDRVTDKLKIWRFNDSEIFTPVSYDI